MEDQSVVGVDEHSELGGHSRVSDFVHDQHFIINDDLYDVHDERSVRRRRGASQTFHGKIVQSTTIYFGYIISNSL